MRYGNQYHGGQGHPWGGMTWVRQSSPLLARPTNTSTVVRCAPSLGLGLGLGLALGLALGPATMWARPIWCIASQTACRDDRGIHCHDRRVLARHTVAHQSPIQACCSARRLEGEARCSISRSAKGRARPLQFTVAKALLPKSGRSHATVEWLQHHGRAEGECH